MHAPFILVIFGATGDLSRNKLMPALFSLYKQQLLPEQFFIVGFSRRDMSDDKFREFIGYDLKFQGSLLHAEFLKHIYYQQGFFDQREGYESLLDRLATFDKELGACITRIFYLATPPNHYESILDNMKETTLSEGCGPGAEKWTRIAIEKPFGKDLETAKALDQKLAEIFTEEQIFRVDHYLGKDTLQNMIAFRFANNFFEHVWNKEYIDHVQITATESIDVSTRGKFFDGVGNLRDWGQNHIMQIAAAIVMEQPKHFSREPIRDVRVAALRAIRPILKKEVAQYVVRGQYEGYRQTKDVDPHSKTETFVAMKMYFDTPRFMDVPFYIRFGKNMAKRSVEINIVFKQTCHVLFKDFGCPEIGNVLRIRIEPDEGIGMRVVAKIPGEKVSLGTVEMKFSYQEEFGRRGADAYTKLLLDIFSGDQMLFNRSDELEYTWNFITDILKGWEESNPPLPLYAPGSWGPKEGFELIERDGRKWIA